MHIFHKNFCLFYIESAGCMLATLHEVDINNVGSNDEVEVTESDVVVEGFQEEQIGDTDDDETKIIVTYAGIIVYVIVLQFAIKSLFFRHEI